MSVLGFTDFENVITTCPFVPIPVAPFTGVTDTTVGAVVSATLAVVNVVTTYALSVFPAKSRTKSCVHT